MSRGIRFALVLGIAVLALSVSVGPAVAQEDNETESRSIEIDTSAVEPADDNETASQAIDDRLNLMSWNYNDDREGFELRFSSDRTSRITITEAVQFSEGSGQGRIYQTRVPAGPSEIFVPVPRRGGQAAVTMVTPLSLQENRFSYVSTGEASPNRPALDYERVQVMVILTAGLAAGGTLGVFVYRREDESRDYERIL